MDNQDIRSLSDQGTLGQVNLLVAAITLVVTDDVTLDLLLESFLYSADVFDRQGHVVIVFDTLLDLSALGADHLTALLSAEDARQQVLALCWLQSVVEAIEEYIEELLSVFLLCSVRGLAVKLLEGEAEWLWVVIHSL